MEWRAPASQLTFERIWFGFCAFLVHQLLTPLLNLLVPVYDVLLEERSPNETRTAWCVPLPATPEAVHQGGYQAPGRGQLCLSYPTDGNYNGWSA